MSICAGCHAGCCRSFAVPLSGADILRIERERGVEFWNFACRWEDSQGVIAGRYAPHFHFDDEPETPFAICLQHVPSATLPGSTRCQFLNEEAPSVEFPRSRGSCGAYSHRPAACRVFPTTLHDSGLLAVIEPVPSCKREGHPEAYALCPRPWTPEDLDPVQSVQDLVLAKFEMQFFHVVASRWNRQPGAWADFPEFLHIVYEHRVMTRDADEIDAELPAVVPFEALPKRHQSRAA